jgi:hypothetical protein
LLNPDLMNILRKWISKVKDERGQPVKELGALTLENFLEFYKSQPMPFNIVK